MSTGEVWSDVAAERVLLVEQLLERPVPESDLHVADAHRAELVQPLGQEVGCSRQRPLADVPPRGADVEALGDRAELDGPVADGTFAVLEQELDLRRHVGAGRALGEPAVTPFRGAPQRGLRRAADPDRQRMLAGPGCEAGVVDVAPVRSL